MAALQLLIDPYPAGLNNDQKRQMVYGTVQVLNDAGTTLSSGTFTYTAGGINVKWLTLEPIKVVTLTPNWLDMKSVSGSGYTYQWVLPAGSGVWPRLGGPPAAGYQAKIKILTSAGAEITATVPSAVQTDNIRYRAEFLRAI